MKPTLSTSEIPFHLQDKLDKIEFKPNKRRPWPLILLVIILLHVGLFTLLQKDLLSMFHRALGKKVIYVNLVPASTPFSVPTPEPSVKPAAPSTNTAPPATKPLTSTASSQTPAAPSATPASSAPAPAPVPAAAESKGSAASSTAPAPTSATAPKLISSTVRFIQAPQPNYPTISRSLGEQGRVLLRVLINEFGKPEQVEISQSSGFGRLDAAARLAVLQALFSPHLENGRAITVLAEVPIVFELEA